ncbi:nickel-dependent lactate racemase family protein [Flindersiella endophytica]
MDVVGGPGTVLTEDDARSFVTSVLGSAPLDGKSLCVIVPDSTRSFPLPMLMSALHSAVAGRVSRLTVLVALGTHPAMTPEQLSAHVGPLPGATVVNHEWWDPEALVPLGELSAAQVSAATDGRMNEPVVIRINRHVVEHDVALVAGPVFPHEVVGFSGGNKYFFPGVAGSEIIDLSHWLGALITNVNIIGAGYTPVRALIDQAARLIPAERLCLAAVVKSGSKDLHFLSFGTPEETWEAASAVSAETHVRWLDRPYRRVLSLVSERYDEIWTASKGMYKVEPIVADGGEVVLYAPHVREISLTHGHVLEKVGYHCMDYFTKQWDQFEDYPHGVLAHSTHLRGTGTFSAAEGERCRIQVTLATGIDEQKTRSVALGYLDPATIDPVEWAKDPDTLVIPNAGEILHRLR